MEKEVRWDDKGQENMAAKQIRLIELVQKRLFELYLVSLLISQLSFYVIKFEIYPRLIYQQIFPVHLFEYFARCKLFLRDLYSSNFDKIDFLCG